MPYNPRTHAQRAKDFPNAKAFEQLVGTWLPDPKTDQTNSTTGIDWLVNEKVGVEVKEKNQKYNSKNWKFPKDVAEQDVFILDELSIMRSTVHFPSVYFVLHDNVDKEKERFFLAPIAYIIASNKEMVNRVGPTGVAKGKWLVDVTQFKLIEDPAQQLWDCISQFEKDQPWFKSACLLPTH